MRSTEKIRPPVGGRKWKKDHPKNGERLNTHYSRKPDHAQRSVANHPRKKSKRR